MEKNEKISLGSFFILKGSDIYKTWILFFIQELIGFVTLNIFKFKNLYKFIPNFLLVIICFIILTVSSCIFLFEKTKYQILYFFQIIGMMAFNIFILNYSLYYIFFYFYLFSSLWFIILSIYSFNSKNPSFPYLLLIQFISIIIFLGVFSFFIWNKYFLFGIAFSVIEVYIIIIGFIIIDYLELEDDSFIELVSLRFIQFLPYGSIFFSFFSYVFLLLLCLCALIFKK